MSWEQFQRRMRPSPKSPMVSLSKSGLIGLNAAIARNILGDSRYALLLFDRERSLIGIKLVKDTEPDAYPIKTTKSLGHASLSGLAFMKAYGILPQETKAFAAEFEAANRLIVVDVSAAVGIGRGGKKKAKT